MGPNSVNINGAARARSTATRFTHRGKQYEVNIIDRSFLITTVFSIVIESFQ